MMSRPVRTIASSASMRDAGELMARWGHGGLPIADEGVLVGIVTRKDVDKAVRHGLEHAPVTGFMTRDVLTVAPGTDLRELERVLASRGIGRVPVLDGNVIVGIVTRKDVLRAEYGDAYIDRRIARAPEATERFLASVSTLLPADARDALRLLGETAASSGLRAHVVGGFVRDMLLARPNLDIDVVIEGDGIAFAEKVAERVGVRLKVHRRFGTAVIPFSRELHVDVASARAEYYTRPGALPTVERSSLRQDLLPPRLHHQRDGGVPRPRVLRRDRRPVRGSQRSGRRHRARAARAVVRRRPHARAAGRAVRDALRVRDGRADRGLARRAVAMGLLEEISGARLREELLAILEEDDPALHCERLEALGALPALPARGVRHGRRWPTCAPSWSRSRQMPAARAAAALGVPLRCSWRSPVAAGRPPWTAGSSACASAGRCRRWPQEAAHGRRRAAASLERPRAVARLAPARAARPAHARGARLRARGRVGRACARRVDRFAEVLSHVRLEVSGDDLVAMGADPSAAFSDILTRIRARRLDGAVAGRTAELDDLRRLAVRAGLIPAPRRKSLPCTSDARSPSSVSC